jgi:uncharacterized protein
MRALVVAALLVGATCAHAQGNAKKDLVAKVLQTQQGGIENIARGIVERPAFQMLQAAGPLVGQLPADKREAAGKAIEAEVRKYVDEATPVLRQRAIQLAPASFGAALEEKFSEDELRQLLAWLESPVNRKYQQALPELQDNFVKKLIAEGGPLIDPKLQALQDRVRGIVGAAAPTGAASAPRAPRAATPAARPASK